MRTTAFFLNYLPTGLLKFLMRLKKQIRRKQLKRQMETGGFTSGDILRDLKKIGIREGDSVLVHGSLSKMGFIEGGAGAVIEALLNVIGKEGTLLMPAFPAPRRNKDYMDSHKVFDAKHTPSKMGVLSESFRQMPETVRSLHPTDSVCALGPMANFYTSGHLGQLRPYNENSPFRRLAEKNGKILMLGTTLNGACTSLHMLEDAVEFPYPVYLPGLYSTKIIDKQGMEFDVQTFVHNPAMSVKRNADALLPWFKKAGIIKTGKVCEAQSLLIESNGLLNTMVSLFNDKGITMYSPKGI